MYDAVAGTFRDLLTEQFYTWTDYTHANRPPIITGIHRELR